MNVKSLTALLFSLVSTFWVAHLFAQGSVNDWKVVSGGLKHVSVGADATVWGVKSGDALFRHNSDNTWTHIPGLLKQVSVGNANNTWGINSSAEHLCVGVQCLVYADFWRRLIRQFHFQP